MLNPFLMMTYKNMFKGFYYTIQKDDNLEKISKRYRIPVNNIISANNLTYPYTLNEGERVFIPGIDEPLYPEAGAIYTIKFGDNIEGIAQRYGISVQEIMEKNFVSDKRMFYVGQKILIPSKQSTEPAVTDGMANQNNKDEIKIYPLSPFLPKPGSREYEAVNILGKKFAQLKRGSKGKDVIMLQRMLTALGRKLRKLDGVFGSELESEIRKIQQEAGLDADGIVDEKVWQYIFSEINKGPAGMNR